MRPRGFRFAAIPSLAFALFAVPSAIALPVTLVVVDQHGNEIPASQLQVGGVLYPTGAAANLAPGNHTLRIMPGIHSATQTNDLYRDESVEVLPTTTELRFQWWHADFTVRLVDQFSGVDDSATFAAPAAYTATHRAGSPTFRLPVTVEEPGYQTIQGRYASGVDVRIAPSINGIRQLGELYRVESVGEHGSLGTVQSFIWKRSGVSIRVVDQVGAVDDSATVILPSTSFTARFAKASPTFHVPITEESVGDATYEGHLAAGYGVGLCPSLLGSPQSGALRRDEAATEVPEIGLVLTREWKRADLSLRVIDQDGALDSAATIYVPGRAGLAAMARGVAEFRLPVTVEQPGEPSYYGGLAGGYPAEVEPSINGWAQLNPELARMESPTELDIAGAVRLFEWKRAELTLQVVDQEGALDSMATIFVPRRGGLSAWGRGVAVFRLPVTVEQPGEPDYYGGFADGYPAEIEPSINGRAQINPDLVRTETPTELTAEGVARTIEWKRAELTLQVVDQEGELDSMATIFVPGRGGLSAWGRGVAVFRLPVTVEQPGEPDYYGGFADGYPAEIEPSINGRAQINPDLVRTETPTELATEGATRTIEWKRAELTLLVVDQGGAPDDSARFYVPANSGASVGLSNAATVRLPVTEDPSAPPTSGLWSQGYDCLVFPSVNGRPASHLQRAEDFVPLREAGLTRTFVWKRADLTLRLVDQSGAPDDSGRFYVPEISGTGVDVRHGGTVRLPVTSDPSAPPTAGLWSAGYDVRVFPSVSGRPASHLQRVEDFVPLTEAGLTRTFVWKRADLMLRLVDQGGLLDEEARFLVQHHPSLLGPGQSLRYPVTEDPLSPPIVGEAAAGYEVRIYPSIADQAQSSKLWRTERVTLPPAGRLVEATWPRFSGEVILVDPVGVRSANAEVSGADGAVQTGRSSYLPATESSLILEGTYSSGYPINISIPPSPSIDTQVELDSQGGLRAGPVQIGSSSFSLVLSTAGSLAWFHPADGTAATGDTVALSRLDFEDPMGECRSRGWTGMDRATTVFGHVSSRFLVDAGPVRMQSRALWFGADSSSAVAETRDWVQPFGYGNNWSQRLTSPEFDLTATQDPRIEFDALLGFTTSAGARGARGAEFLAVQVLDASSAWRFLNIRCQSTSGASLLDSTVTGHDTLRVECRLRGDGNESIPLGPTSRLRVVVQTDARESHEDGRIPAGPGAVVIDNVIVRGSDGADIIEPMTCEDGGTGAWVLTALNGDPSAVHTRILDGTDRGTAVALARSRDPHDPTCVWTFLSPGDSLARGSYSRLGSSWIPVTDREAPVGIAMEGRFSVRSRGRVVAAHVLAKNVGDERPRLYAASPTRFHGGPTNDDLGAYWGAGTMGTFPEGFGATLGAGYDSLKLFIEVFDPAAVMAPAEVTPTRLPVLDRVLFYQVATDRDRDGVSDRMDACPDVSSAGQDGDEDGCPDPTSTMRHQESWPASRLPIAIRLPHANSAHVADGSDLSAIRDGIAAWQATAGAAIAVQELPPGSNSFASSLDGINQVTFGDDEYFPPGVIALTPTTSFTRRAAFDDRIVLPGQIVDADLLFNPRTPFRTATVTPPGASFDLQSVATHEVGHLLGLTHSGVESATMFPVLLPDTAAASLAEDDRAAARAAYPGPTYATDFATITGSVRRGGSGAPVPGALVIAVRLDGGLAPIDTTASDFTREDGSYALRGLPPGDYGVHVSPLDGSVPGVVPGAISERLHAIAVTDFLAEWWSAVEDSADDRDARTALAMAAGATRTSIDLITTVDTTPPAVASSRPGNGAAGIRIDTAIQIDFVKPIAPASLEQALSLHITGDTQNVGGRGQLLQGGSRLVFVPATPLAYDTEYELELSTALTDRGGLPLPAPFTSRFRTESQPEMGITAAYPQPTVAGGLLTILGSGFDPAHPTSQWAVFDSVGSPGVIAVALRVTSRSMVVRVPAGVGDGWNLKVATSMSPVPTSPLPIQILEPRDALSLGARGGSVPLHGAPSDVVVSPDGRTVLTVGPGGVESIDTEDVTLGAVLRSQTPGDRAALTANGAWLLVTQRQARRVLRVVADPAQGEFGAARDTIELDHPVDGVIAAPDGRRAFVVSADSQAVLELDIEAASVTQGTVLRQVRIGRALVGDVAIDPSGRYLVLPLRGSGWVTVDMDAAQPENTLRVVEAGSSTGAVAIGPDGNRTLLVGDAGGVSVATGSLAGETFMRAGVDVGGSARDVLALPDGRFALVPIVAANRVSVIDLEAATGPAVVFTTPTGSGPVAIGASASGAVAAVASAAARSVSVYALGSNGDLREVVPGVGIPGDRVAALASGSQFGTGTGLAIGAEQVAPLHAVGTAVAFAVPPLPSQATSVALLPALGAPTLALPFAVLPPIEAPAVRATPLRIAPRGLPCAGDTARGPIITIRETPSGDRLAVLQGPFSISGVCDVPASVAFFAASDGSSSPFGAPEVHVPLPTGVPRDWAFAPDGKRLWVALDDGSAGAIAVVDLDPESPRFGTVVESLVPEGLGSPSSLAADPLGRFLFAASETGGRVVRLATSGAVLDTIDLSPHSPQALAITRDGRYLCVGGEDRLWLHDVAASTPLASTPPRANFPVRELVLPTRGASVIGHSRDERMGVWNLDETAGPIGAELHFGAVLAPGDSLGSSVPAPDGIGVIGATSRALLAVVGLAALPPDIDAVAIDGPHARLARAVDGRRMWIATQSSGADTIRLWNLVPATRATLSGEDERIGAPGAVLPQPVRVQVTDVDGAPVSGVVVRFALADDESGRLDGDAVSALRLTDLRGEAQVVWTLPETERTSTLGIACFGLPVPDLTVSARTVAEDALAEPVLLATGPADGARDISSRTSVYVRFSQRMDSASVASRLELTAGTSLVAGTFRVAEQGRLVFFQPEQPLPYGATCLMRLAHGATDLEGQTLAQSLTTSFTVEPAPSVVVEALSPPAAQPGAPVVVVGRGFAPLAGDNAAFFDGVFAPAASVAENGVVVKVPYGAGSGDFWVRASGHESNRIPFQMLARDSSSPSPVDSLQLRRGIREIVISPDGARAYVTNPEWNSIAAVKLHDLTQQALIPVGRFPQAIAILPGLAPKAYVANRLDNDVSVVDVAPVSPTYHRVVGAIAVGQDPVDVAVSPATGQVLVVNLASGTLDIVDAREGSATYHRVVSTVNTGSGSKGVVVTPDGTLALIATATGLTIVDLATHAVVSTVNTGSGSKGVVVTPDGTLALVLTEDGRLLVIVLARGPDQYQVVSTVNTGSGSKGVVVTPDGTLVYVTIQDENRILVLRLVVSGGSPSGAGNIPGPRVQLVEVERIFTGEAPHGVAVDPYGAFAVVANEGSGVLTLLQLHPASMDDCAIRGPEVAFIECPVTYRAATIVPGAKFAWSVQGPAVIDGPSNQDSVVIRGTVAGFATINLRVSRGTEHTECDRRVRIGSCVTSTQVTSFTGRTGGESVEIRWRLSDVEGVRGAEVERGESLDGPWVRLAGEARFEGGEWSLVDRPEITGIIHYYRLRLTLVSGEILLAGPIAVTVGLRVTDFGLGPAMPNPAHRSARLELSLPRAAWVRLAVLDLQGREISMLVNERLRPGRHFRSWDGTHGAGRAAAGVYFVRMEVEGSAWVRRLVLLR
jgi:DNA-binding beta-propeller fold protein YncE